MSKSLGNSVLVSEMVKHWRPIVLRYYLGTPHYRSMIEYSEEALREAESAFARIEGFMQRVTEKAGETPELYHRGAARLRRGDGRRPGRAAGPRRHPHHRPAGQLGARRRRQGSRRRPPRRGPRDARRPGPRPVRPALGGEADRGEDLHGAVDTLVRLVLDQREAARTRKDWATADAIRDQLQQSGLVIEDSPTGPRWTLGPR